MLKHLVRKHKTHHKRPNGLTFSWMALIVGIGSSAFWTIFPLILKNAVQSTSIVGYYFSALAVVALVGCILTTGIFTRFSRVSLIKNSLIAAIFIMILMTAATEIWQIAGLDIPRALLLIIIFTALSLFIRDYTKKRDLACAEGQFYLFANLGWLIGPVLAGYSAATFGNRSMFILVGLCYLAALVYFLYQHIQVKHPAITHQKHPEGLPELWEHISSYFQRAELRKVFIVGFGLSFWWAISSIYIPIAVEEMGFTQDIVGWVVTGGIVPLILLEQLVGNSATRNGVKSFIIIGFLVLAAFVLNFPLLADWPILLLVAFALVNIGAAFIEPLQDTYFFEVSKKQDIEKHFGIYNTSDPIAFIIGPIMASIVILASGSIDAIWLMTGLVMLVFALFSFTIQKKY